MKSFARAVAVVVTLIAACGDEEELPEVDCGEGTIPTYDEVVAFDTCVACHSSELSGSARMDAPGDVNFDTYEAAKKDAEEAASEVNEGAMPPAPLSLTAEEKDQLYKWALCGTPE